MQGLTTQKGKSSNHLVGNFEFVGPLSLLVHLRSLLGDDEDEEMGSSVGLVHQVATIHNPSGGHFCNAIIVISWTARMVEI